MKTTLCFLALFAATQAFAQDAGRAGAFARMGYSARGMAMGNAMCAVTTGDITGWYNPALSAYADTRRAFASFGILSLDRTFNVLGYTQAIQPTAGISFGLINAGVHSIDGRDGAGNHTDDYSTYEDQFFLSFSNRVADNVSLGATIKVYHSKLFDQMTTTTVGFDIGAAVRVTDRLTAAAAVVDINSRYKWDSKDIYDATVAQQTTDKFPTLRKIGFSYVIPNGVVSAEFENSSESTNIFRFGAEYAIVENFAVRGGVDRLDSGDDATGAKPTAGFSLKKSVDNWTPELQYAYVVESFAPHGMHIITLSAGF